MRKILLLSTLLAITQFFTVPVVAKNKVELIPLASAFPSRIAVPAMAKNKVELIPLNSSSLSTETDKLWGKGRPGATTTSWILHTGIHVANSTLAVPWYASESACPISTWVCSASDIDVSKLEWNSSSTGSFCDGTVKNFAPLAVGWLSDAGSGGSDGKIVADDDGTGGAQPYIIAQPTCVSYPVLCCKY